MKKHNTLTHKVAAGLGATALATGIFFSLATPATAATPQSTPRHDGHGHGHHHGHWHDCDIEILGLICID